MLSDREMIKLISIKNTLPNKTIIERAKSYDGDVQFLISLVNRLDTLKGLSVEEKIELNDLRRMKSHVVKFANEIGLNEGAIG